MASALVVYRLDRLARDLVLQETLLREINSLGARVHSTAPSEDAFLDPEGEADDPSRALIRQILGAVSAYERSMIRLRMRSGRLTKRSKGGYIGGTVPYGYVNINGTLQKDESEQRGIATMRQLRGSGLSYRAIGAELDRLAIAPRSGSSSWHPYSVSTVLASTRRTADA